MTKDDLNMRPLKERCLTVDGIVESLQPLIFISFFLPTGVYFLLQGFFVVKDETITFLGATLFGIGVVIAWWFVFQLFFLFIIHFGRWNGFVTRGHISPNDAFRFRFEQQFRLNMEIESIGVFLVFRETVTDVSEGYRWTQTVDRLVQGNTHQGRFFKAGEVMVEECVFQIPNRPMGIRHDFMPKEEQRVTTSWWVKVRLVPAATKREEELNARLSSFIPDRKKIMILGLDDDFWREFEIEVKGEATAAPEEQDELFDIYLCEKSMWIDSDRIKAIGPFVPHLDSHQLRSCSSELKDILFREHLSGHDAQEIKAQLAERGVEVRLQPISHLER